ncbi:MAG TPA: imidazole glycerol phosphate synthase subunit HisH [Candidatus Acidoferrales bacterium]|nr:imidazole glycerol phosphate synthase subunit HisH [Candidatus Acidoferrales bacterium]
MKIALVDYGAGNLPSVERALRRLGAETERVVAGDALLGARAIVLPGVGHFGALARALSQNGLAQALGGAVGEGAAFLGICLGLQALYDRSDEAPDQPGLGWFPGVVRPLPAGLKLPHMGWNQLRLLRPSALLAGIPPDAYFYFAHSYAALDSGPHAVAVCDYGASFVAVLERGRVGAVQFHPEKSGEPGAAVLRNFLELAR